MSVLPAAVLGVTTILGIAWLSRWRATRRLRGALDAYAEREILGRIRAAPPPSGVTGRLT
jgi:hypothetical protein